MNEQITEQEGEGKNLPALTDADAAADADGTERPNNPGLNTNAA